jgi:hypothetical protein
VPGDLARVDVGIPGMAQREGDGASYGVIANDGRIREH